MLDSLPIIVMEKIFDKLNLASLITLRQVNKDIRLLVDNSHAFSKVDKISVTFKIQSAKSLEQFNPISSLEYLLKKMKNLKLIVISNLHFLSLDAIRNLNRILKEQEKMLALKNFKGDISKLFKLLNGLSVYDLVFDYEHSDYGDEYLYTRQTFDLIRKTDSYQMDNLKIIRFFNCPTIYIMNIITSNQSIEHVNEIIIFQHKYHFMRTKVKSSYNKVVDYLNDNYKARVDTFW